MPHGQTVYVNANRVRIVRIVVLQGEDSGLRELPHMVFRGPAQLTQISFIERLADHFDSEVSVTDERHGVIPARYLAQPGKRRSIPRGIPRRCRTLPTDMTKVEALEREVEKLNPEELAAFRDWFLEHDWEAWDRQIERDSAEGRLDRFAAEALAEFERGETREI